MGIQDETTENILDEIEDDLKKLLRNAGTLSTWT